VPAAASSARRRRDDDQPEQRPNRPRGPTRPVPHGPQDIRNGGESRIRALGADQKTYNTRNRTLDIESA